jgi:hypothetical protein
MGAAWLTLRADVRRRWRPMLGMVLLIGLVSGVVLVAAAGARRTSTAYPRLPQVTSVSAVDLLGVAVQPPHGPPDLNINTTGSLDATTGLTVNRVRVLAGRAAAGVSPAGTLRAG